MKANQIKLLNIFFKFKCSRNTKYRVIQNLVTNYEPREIEFDVKRTCTSR